jgi:dienelactone hydrolase
MDSKIQFRDASPPPSAWAPSFDGERWLLEPSQQLYWFAEADDCSDDPGRAEGRSASTGRSLETAAYLARNRKFRSSNLAKGATDSTGKLGAVGFCFGGGESAGRPDGLGSDGRSAYGAQPAPANALKIKAPITELLLSRATVAETGAPRGRR